MRPRSRKRRYTATAWPGRKCSITMNSMSRDLLTLEPAADPPREPHVAGRRTAHTRQEAQGGLPVRDADVQLGAEVGPPRVPAQRLAPRAQERELDVGRAERAERRVAVREEEPAQAHLPSAEAGLRLHEGADRRR